MSANPVYYNEFDEYAAQWLRNLMAAGLIPAGEIDTRSITDVHANDLLGFSQCHFFAGIAGWPLALAIAGWPTDRPIWTGSAPCQPFSSAGKQEGYLDPRDLWPVFFDLIAERRPPVVMGEQVDRAVGFGWLDRVYADMEREGYAFDAAILPACSVDSPHRRYRIFFVGDTGHEGLEGHGGHGDAGRKAQSPGPDAPASGGGVIAPGLDALSVLRRDDLHLARVARSGLRLPADRRVGPRPLWAEFEALACSDGWRRVRSGSFPMANGLSNRVGRLRAYGNAIVPEVAAQVVKAFMAARP